MVRFHKAILCFLESYRIIMTKWCRVTMRLCDFCTKETRMSGANFEPFSLLEMVVVARTCSLVTSVCGCRLSHRS